ncbi:tripartite tricarboxylate transporter substrate binding protein [Lacisediminimonas sp.]|uniref:Bug family tripartite tricarboxylate transporter substrate binding protein n=1 Tax=Lacisediminimonas sp. TaxID=3060582 RepID=UPI002717A837|nr:tripartite tricarboxylate transporter substrate binding protein [Lacisediminimonas sp.]MDO8298288.1 tripartite tricarboxylate transporter substrate binding protein [Lacisediminimonas sp.]
MTKRIGRLNRRVAMLVFTALGLAAIVPVAGAQPAGDAAVRLIVPYPPGGTTDIIGRILGEKLGDALKQTVITENRPGAGGNIGAALVAKSRPDGSALLVTAVSTPAIAHTLYNNLQYDLRRDLEPVAVVGSLPFVLLVSNNIPAKSTAELLALIRSRPGKYNFGSAGNGTTAHLAGELFKSMAGIQITHVPYKGNGPALTDLMGGHLDMMFDFLPSALQLVSAGKVRAIAVSSTKRSSALPNVPTLAESGVPGYDVLSYFGVMAPSQTPKATIAKLNAEINRISMSPENRARYAREGVEPAAESPEWYAKYLDFEITRWGKVIREAGVKAQ